MNFKNDEVQINTEMGYSEALAMNSNSVSQLRKQSRSAFQ